ncbi:MAG: GrpE protein [Solirubrobacterales bacterium]|jgi:molecular chaperone GrpE|nr:GrpE protein [Solirubrobacterales bacterium]
MSDQSPNTAEELDGHQHEAGAPAPAEAEVVEAAEAIAVEQDLDELTAKAAQRDEYLALAQRTQADFENFRKRAARDAQVAAERGTAKVVKELLPALDNLERAIAAAEAEEADEEHHLTKGIRLVQRDLAGALERVGIETFSPKGDRFDPNEHEAIVQHPVEGAESGTVVEVYQQGYRLNGTVIRPARVVVAA